MLTDARVLQADFVPRDVIHRDAEINYLSSTLRPITDGDPADPAFLYGPSGTGKTCIARYTVEQLREEVIDVTTNYVNCWENHSTFKALYRVLDGIDSTVDVHRQSTPTDLLLDRIREQTTDPYVVILDEVDQLDDKSLLYELYRVSGLTMILIANQESDVFGRIDERVASRFSAMPRIHFDKYSVEELVGILNDRARWGLREDAITDVEVRNIAQRADGDARVAIGILRAAARLADGSNTSTITPSLVSDAVSEAKAEIKQKSVEKLTTDQRILYEIIADEGQIGTGDLYDRYVERADDPKTQRMIRNYLQKLRHYNLVVAEGDNRGRAYRLPDDGRQ